MCCESDRTKQLMTPIRVPHLSSFPLLTRSLRLSRRALRECVASQSSDVWNSL